MGRPTERDLDHLARETGYDGLSLEKMIRLFGILQAIGRDGFLGGRLALKGGTALNAFHLRLKRLSLDIDFNHLNPLSDDMWLSERKEVDAAVSRIVRGQGYKPSGPRVRGPRSRWDLPFASALGQDETLHIDLGYADCRPLFGASRMSSAKVGGWGATDILVLSLEDVIAGKLAALTRRTLSRDLFDARSILSMEGLDWRALRAASLASIAGSPDKWRSRNIRGRRNRLEACESLLSCLPRQRFRDDAETVEWYNKSIEDC